MKKIAFIAAALFSITQICSAATVCGSATLASYVGFGAGGCTIGNDTLFSFQVLSGTAGATELSASSIMLSPLGGTANPGLTAAATVTSRAGVVQESFFTYQISGASITGSSLTLSNSSETGDGAVTGIGNLCVAGAFGSTGVSGCTGTSLALVTVDGVMNSDSVVFKAAAALGVTDDLTIDGGTMGSASGATLVNRFTAASTATPEPMSFLLTGFGLACAAGLRFRFARQ